MGAQEIKIDISILTASEPMQILEIKIGNQLIYKQDREIEEINKALRNGTDD